MAISLKIFSLRKFGVTLWWFMYIQCTGLNYSTSSTSMQRETNLMFYLNNPAGKMGQSYPLGITCFNLAKMTKELAAGLNSLLPQGKLITFQEKVYKQFWHQLTKSLTHPLRVKSKKATMRTCSWNLSITLMALSLYCILWQNALLN